MPMAEAAMRKIVWLFSDLVLRWTMSNSFKRHCRKKGCRTSIFSSQRALKQVIYINLVNNDRN